MRGALGPYLNVFLVTQQHWSQSEVGLVTTIGGLLGLAVADADRRRDRRDPRQARRDRPGARRAGQSEPSIIFAWPTFWPVAIANSLMAIVGDVFGPAVAALTLGLYARKQLARRMGRNSAFDHAGNVAIAVVAGAVGYAFSQRAVFLLVPVFAVLAGIAVLSIPAEAIDFDRARDLERRARRGGRPRPAPPATASCSSPGRWSSSACASCCSISPMRRCCRWWDRSLPPPIRKRRRP